MLFNRFYVMIGGAVVGLVAMVFIVLLIRSNGEKTQEIRNLKGELATAAAALEQASEDIKRFAANEGVTLAEAAKVCAAEGSTAFDRGVQVGTAICQARQ